MSKVMQPSLRFEFPVEAPDVPLASPGAGVAAQDAMPESETRTILDTPDCRLLRAGVAVAHHVAGGHGWWSLRAPSWEPLLPSEHTEPVDASMDLPAAFARLTRPIARGETLRPLAELKVERLTRPLLTPDALTLGTLVDEKFVLSRDDGSRVSYRQCVVSPSPAMTAQQREFVAASVLAAGGRPVVSFPTLQNRIGPPATGLTDFPEPRPLRKDATMEELVAAVFASDLRALVHTLLATEALGEGDLALDAVRRHTHGLAHALDPAWVEDVEALLEELAGLGWAESLSPAVRVVDALVGAVHAPRLGDVGSMTAAPLLHVRAGHGVAILVDRCGLLEPDSPAENWGAARSAAARLADSAQVALAMRTRTADKLFAALDSISRGLDACVAQTDEPVLEGTTPREAYELGQWRGRADAHLTAARADFVRRWPKRLARIVRLHRKGRPT